MEEIGKGVLVFIALLINIFARGVAIMFNWAWFIVPLGVPGIGLAHAIGLGGITTFMTISVLPKETVTPMEAGIFSVMMSIYVIIAGFIVHLFM